MLPTYEMPVKRCAACCEEFRPKRGGYNALYCSRRCKARAAGLRPRVKAQRKVAARRSYQRIKSNPKRYAKHLKQTANSKTNVRRWLADYKKKKGCKDCGYRKHSAALQLDHEGKKSAHISDIRSSVRRLMQEIRRGKCVVRCANCHAVRTWCQKNGLKHNQGNKGQNEAFTAVRLHTHV